MRFIVAEPGAHAVWRHDSPYLGVLQRDLLNLLWCPVEEPTSSRLHRSLERILGVRAPQARYVAQVLRYALATASTRLQVAPARQETLQRLTLADPARARELTRQRLLAGLNPDDLETSVLQEREEPWGWQGDGELRGSTASWPVQVWLAWSFNPLDGRKHWVARVRAASPDTKLDQARAPRAAPLRLALGTDEVLEVRTTELDQWGDLRCVGSGQGDVLNARSTDPATFVEAR